MNNDPFATVEQQVLGQDLRPRLEGVRHRYPNEVAVTAFSGIEYGINDDGTFAWASKTIDGYDLTEAEFLSYLDFLGAAR